MSSSAWIRSGGERACDEGEGRTLTTLLVRDCVPRRCQRCERLIMSVDAMLGGINECEKLSSPSNVVSVHVWIQRRQCDISVTGREGGEGEKHTIWTQLAGHSRHSRQRLCEGCRPFHCPQLQWPRPWSTLDAKMIIVEWRVFLHLQ